MFTLFSKRAFIAAVIAATAFTTSATALAQQIDSWPTKPITIIVPSTAGGSGDILMRIVADGLEKQLKQPIVVMNKSGGSGTIGLRAALLAPNDGYTFVMTGPSSLIAAQFTMTDLPFVPTRDFVPVGGLAVLEMVVSTSAAVPSANLQDFVKWGKSHADKLMYGSYGNGTYGHLVAEHFATSNQLKATHIPYKAEKEMLVAVASNEVTYGVSVATAARAMQESGRTRMLGVLAPRRSTLAPDVPTFREQGLNDPALALLGWNALFASRATPAGIVRRMESALVAAVNDENVKRRLIAASLVPWAANSNELQDVWRNDIPVYKALAAGVAPAK